MAHFALSIDSDPSRRDRFARAATAALKAFPKLHIHQIQCGDLVVVIARNRTAPHSIFEAPGNAAFLLGYALDEAGHWLDARSISATWTASKNGASGFDGYFIAGTYCAERGLVLGSDLLGFFPVYHAETGGALVVSSSPQLLQAHPLMKPALDERGLIGVLLINSLLADRPLLKSVRRMKPGHQLRWSAAGVLIEREVFSLSNLACNAAISEQQACEVADAELLRAIRRHRPDNTPTTLMLSGGLDSRLMAAYLQSEQITNSAVGLGRPTDLETGVGRRVATELGWDFRFESSEFTAAEFGAAAALTAKWEHLAGGFSHVEGLRSAEIVGSAAPMSWSGFALEDVLGGDAFIYGWNPERGEWSFETIFSHFNAWGLPRHRIAELFTSPDAAELAREAVEELRLQYNHGTAPEPGRASLLKLLTRARYHIGSVIHRLSFGSWPLLPILDRRLLETQFAMPSALKQNRALQKNLLLRKSPQLARIPREHNSFLFEPLHPSPFAHTIASFQKRFRRWYWQKWRKEEPRRYYRLYQMNGPNWRAAREAAEPHRARLEQWMNRKVLDSLLPPPGQTLSFKEPISGSGVSRLLIGLALWSARDC